MAKSEYDITAPRFSKRELNKQDKLLRIRQAATTVFLSKGYEAATVREIAAEADVAFGTLFLYAKNKQDLLLLLFDEELPALSDRAILRAASETAFIDQLIAFFSELYDFFVSTPGLSRDMLREITFSTGGVVASRIWTSNQATEQHLSRLVSHAQAAGQISSAISPALAAHVVFSLYRVEIRFCLDHAEPDVPASLANLRRQFEVVLAGLKPTAALANTPDPMLRQTTRKIDGRSSQQLDRQEASPADPAHPPKRIVNDAP
jgi:AcrR family transcriptional regulator